MNLSKMSFGVGDRFAQEAEAQLEAISKGLVSGIDITPVWNKSFREHDIIKSHPSETRKYVDQAVKNHGWTSSYFVDADHINLKTVDFFLDHADFFTLDVADFIDKPASGNDVSTFLRNSQDLIGELTIPGIEKPYIIDENFLENIASKYLRASIEANRIFHYIASKKGVGNFITEISMDEVNLPQSPLELVFILGLLKDIPIRTIAPKFIGQFNKGVDYVGELNRFERDFEELLLVLDYSKKRFDLPEDLKLSIHSGSDKFSLYPIIRKLSVKHNQGIHLKTAGTTWLEEVIGLALSEGESLEMVKTIYQRSWERMDELCTPYQSVIDIAFQSLPQPDVVKMWNGERFANTLRHIQSHPDYNPHFRQLLHIGYKIAAEMGEGYINALRENQFIVSKQVVENLYERHIIPLFM